MRITLAIGLALVGAVGACDGGGARVRKRDCDVVLAHLVVLERGEDDQPMCKYHHDCDGARADRFTATCPKVLTTKQADCYLRAVSLDDADACLPRASFDDELRTGRRSGSSGRGSDDPDDPWFGGGGGGGSDAQLRRIMREVRDLKDDACSCTDRACADRIQHRFEDFGRRYKDDPSLSKQDDLMKVIMEAYECVAKVGSGYGSYDAGVPDAYSYRDPYYYGSPDAATPLAPTGMMACDQYGALIDRLDRCDKFPTDAKQAYKDTFTQLRQSWGDVWSMSDATRQSNNETCRQMVDGMTQGLAAMGCP